MAIFLDNLALEMGRLIVLLFLLSLVGWTARSIVRVWLPFIKARNQTL
jgi:hypothetical protein